MLSEFITLETLKAAYAGGATPLEVIEEVIARCATCADPAVFICPVPDDALRAAARAVLEMPRDLPLWGVPFAVKDNIDVAGLPTAAACPAYGYDPKAESVVVARLRAAGATVGAKAQTRGFETERKGRACARRLLPSARRQFHRCRARPRGRSADPRRCRAAPA